MPLLLWLLAALPAPPALTLTPEERAALDRDEIVVRSDLSDPSGGTAIGMVDIDAPPDRTLAAVLDLRARVPEISGLKGLEEYGRGPDWVGARWEVKVLTANVVFHVRYEYDTAQGIVRYALDPSRSPNDIVQAEGSYHLLPVEGGTRVIYRATSDSGRPVPGWVKRWLATEGLTQQLTGIRKRAETPP
jgi:hypothetical protein